MICVFFWVYLNFIFKLLSTSKVNCAALVAGWDMAFVLDALFKLFGTCLTTSLSLSKLLEVVT